MKKKQTQEKAKIKSLAAQRVKELSGDSDWTILQQIVQEIESDFIVREQKQYSVEKLRELLTEEVELRYNDDETLKQELLDGIPSRYAISLWRKKKGWEEAVWGKIKDTGLFTPEKRAAVIRALYEKATTTKDTNAAKLYLTLSGDYVEKGDGRSSDVMDIFREINQQLHKNKTS